MEEMIQAGHRIIYCDELCTTKSTIHKADWSAPRHYPKTDISQYHKKTVATIVGVSHERGVELVSNFDKSVD